MLGLHTNQDRPLGLNRHIEEFQYKEGYTTHAL